MGKSEPKTISQWIWSWSVVGGIVLFLLGTGVAFMTSSHPYIADLFFLAGAGLFLVKFLSWDLSKQHQQKKSIQGIAIIITLIITAGVIVGNHYINHISPSSAEVPEFDFKFGAIYSGHINRQPLITIGGLAINRTGPQSALTDWKMIVEFPSGKKIVGEIPMINAKDITIPMSSISSIPDLQFTFRADAYLPRASHNPIIAGGTLEGWLLSIFPNLDFQEAREQRASIVIEFQDVVSRTIHRFSFTPSRWAGDPSGSSQFAN